MIRLMRVAGAQACLCELLQDGEKTENVRRGKERRKESKRKKGGKERRNTRGRKQAWTPVIFGLFADFLSEAKTHNKPITLLKSHARLQQTSNQEMIGILDSRAVFAPRGLIKM